MSKFSSARLQKSSASLGPEVFWMMVLATVCTSCVSVSREYRQFQPSEWAMSKKLMALTSKPFFLKYGAIFSKSSPLGSVTNTDSGTVPFSRSLPPR